MSRTPVAIAVPALIAAGMIICCAARAEVADSPTCSRDVLPILQAHCQACHRPKNVAPMAFLDYNEVRPWAKAIREAVASRKMPPFHARAPIGVFKQDPRLTEEQIDAVLRWVDAGAPQGNPEDAPPPVEWPSAEWTRGEPDLVLEFPEYQAPAGNPDEWVLLFGDTIFDNETWIEAFELRASDFRAVHHVGVFAFEKDIATPEGSLEKIPGEKLIDFIFEHRNLFTWLPGQHAETLPEGSAFVIHPGERVVLQSHVPPLAESVRVKLSLGIWLYNGKLTKSTQDITAFNFELAIPAGDPNYVARKTIPVGSDVTVTGYNVHMHLRGKSAQILFHYPDGGSEVAFDLPRYSFDWQRRYWLSEPKRVPAGTVMEFVGVWDNSADNPLNPDPTTRVGWGGRTADEMYTGMVYILNPREHVQEVANGVVVEPGD